MQHFSAVGISQVGNESGHLRCPRCNSENLNHIGARFFIRHEDAMDVAVVDVEGPGVSMRMEKNQKSGNPSARRHGLVVQFVCEICPDDGTVLELMIAQHKGQTEIGWRYPASARD